MATVKKMPKQSSCNGKIHSPSNIIVCYRVASAQDLVLAYHAGAHDAALSYAAACAGKKKVLHCGYVIKLYSM